MTKESSSSLTWARHDGSPSYQTLVTDSTKFSRSGSNRNSPFANKRKRKNQRAKFTIVREAYNKPILLRLANPDYPLKSRKKYNYWPTYDCRIRIKKIPLPIPRDNPLSKLAVNDLTFSREDYHQYSGGPITIKPVPGGSQPPSWFRTVSGATGYLGNAFPSGWGYGSPSVFVPSSYSAASLATDFAPVVSRLTDAATRKIYSKAKDQSVNLQNFLAEIRSTKDSFGQIIKRVSKTILLLKKGQLKRAVSALFPTTSREIANDVLLFNFGIKPLISDIDGMMKFLAENSSDSVITTSAKSTDTVVTVQSGLAPSPIFYRKEIINKVTKITVKTELSYKVDLPAVKQLIQLGFTNPAATAWEVIPWSFVIDWFCSVGDYIDSLDSWALLQPLSFHTTVFIEQDVLCTAVHDGIVGSADQSYRTTGGPSSWSKKLTYCSRKVGTLPPPPIPSFKSPISTNHIIDSVALLRQLL